MGIAKNMIAVCLAATSAPGPSVFKATGRGRNKKKKETRIAERGEKSAGRTPHDPGG